MSAPIIGELLRKQKGFDGVVCSDDLEMKAIIDHIGIEEAEIRGAIAGIDLFCVCKDHDLQHRALDALIDAVERGDVKANRIA
jgi:beta-N-acetylhexosaminidase